MQTITCPHCDKEFPRWYWAVPNIAGHFGTIRFPGIAKANYFRHEKSCKGKGEKMSQEINQDEVQNQEVFDFLERLRNSGVMNMFSAAPDIMRKFNVDKEKADEILMTWMDQ